MDLEAILVYNYGKNEADFGRIRSLIDLEQKGPDIIMFPEYMFKVKDPLSIVREISDFARKAKCDVVMVPSNHEGYRPNSGIKKSQLLEAGVKLEEPDIEDDDNPSQIGLWFDNNGSTYSFFRSRTKRLHKIPGRDIGISICGEIWGISAKDLEGIGIIYNPSLEGDDICVRGRTMKKFGVSEEKILEDYNMVGNKEAVIRGINGESPYIRHIAKLLEERKIPVLRSDTRNGSGVLFLPSTSRINSLGYHGSDAKGSDGYCRLNLTISR